MSNGFIGYARVSTDDQTTRQQHDELKGAGCADIFEDVISGKTTERDGLDACLKALVPGDTLVVVALDRLGRSAAHVIATVEALGRRGVGFKSLREPMFDTTSPTGEFMLTIFAGLAQLERRIISERTKAVLRLKKLGAKSSAAPFVDAFTGARSARDGSGRQGIKVRRALIRGRSRNALPCPKEGRGLAPCLSRPASRTDSANTVALIYLIS